MEVPPASSFSEVSALFNDTSESQRQQELMGIFPIETPNKHFYSSDLSRAVSHTGFDVELRTNDLHEAHRIFNGPLLYPFQSKAQIFNHKFDPFYYDGSELDPNFNVQENLIGTPLGATTLEDPRMTYVKNMLQMKELHGANHPLDDSYLKELYMVNAEKGSNYYQNQLDKLDASMSHYSRLGRYSKQKPLHDIQFTQNLATGNPIHEKHTARIHYDAPSDAGPINHSRRRKRMMRVDDMTAPYSITPINITHRNRRTGIRSQTQQNPGDLLAVTDPHSGRSAIILPDTPNADIGGYEEENESDDPDHDRNNVVSTLGNPQTNVTPSTEKERIKHERQAATSSSLTPLIEEIKAIEFYKPPDQIQTPMSDTTKTVQWSNNVDFSTELTNRNQFTPYDATPTRLPMTPGSRKRSKSFESVSQVTPLRQGSPSTFAPQTPTATLPKSPSTEQIRNYIARGDYIDMSRSKIPGDDGSYKVTIVPYGGGSSAELTSKQLEKIGKYPREEQEILAKRLKNLSTRGALREQKIAQLLKEEETW